MNIGSLQPLIERKYLSGVFATILAAILVLGGLAVVAADSNEPEGRWRPNSRGPGTPSPFPCTGDGGADGFEFYWDANNNNEHDHIPGTFDSAPSEPVGCFTAEQLDMDDDDEDSDSD